MARCAPRLPIRHLALSVALSCLAVQAQADSIQASATYSLDGNATTSLVAGPQSSGVVDVLEFSNSYWDTTQSAYGIHTYGSSSGDFGSRSSGQGVYDVTGLFVIEKTITNTTGITQNVNFNFDITPGTLSNDIRSSFSGAEYVSAGLLFDIRRDGNQVWTSGATLTTNASGTSYAQSGVDIYTAANATQYSVDGGNYTVDMGVLEAGQSLTLRYTLSTFARGMSTGGGSYTVPEQTIVVPDRTYFQPGYTYECWAYDAESCKGGYGGYGEYGGPVLALTFVNDMPLDMPLPEEDTLMPEEVQYVTCGYGSYEVGTGSCITVTVPDQTYTIPGYTYTVPEQTFYGQVSGSMASSGDPFDYTFNNPYSPSGTYASRANLNLVAAVPEPSTYAMMLACLGVVGLASGRFKKRSTAA